MPWGLGRAMTIAREISIAVHSKPDKWGSKVPRTKSEKTNKFNILKTKQNKNKTAN